MSEAEAWLASRPVAALAMHPDLAPRLFGADWRERLGTHVDLIADVLDGTVPDGADLLDVEVLIACWGCPRLDEHALARMPRLRAVVYAAGSVKGFATDASFARGIRVSSEAATNALPVAEYALASILLAGKRVFAISAEYRETREYRPEASRRSRWGNNGVRVGIIGASRIGRRVIELLRPFDVEVLLYDPVADDEIAGVRRAGLAELLASSDVVSLHAPEMAETRHMIDRAGLASMRDGATLINTARGSLVEQDALVDELRSGRLYAVVDVTEPDVLDEDSPLFDVPNLVLTPHIAGSQGNELLRLGDETVRELARFAAGEPFRHDIAPENVVHLA
ncbi:hydroxyacid dehydrogenase [Agromyces sp. PvR057]|uniref:hydroxyacid dehydrogenase n=1 Tax=Agromyces sp. PvR057 TaxID=3156403 RepID=UPI0033922206